MSSFIGNRQSYLNQSLQAKVGQDSPLRARLWENCNPFRKFIFWCKNAENCIHHLQYRTLWMLTQYCDYRELSCYCDEYCHNGLGVFSPVNPFTILWTTDGERPNYFVYNCKNLCHYVLLNVRLWATMAVLSGLCIHEFYLVCFSSHLRDPLVLQVQQ